MRVPILICDPDENHVDGLGEFLAENSYDVDSAIDGKECQLKVYKNKYQVLILALETQSHSGLVVLKYMRLNAPGVKIILTINNKKTLDDLDLSQKELQALGAGHVLVKPYSNDKMKAAIEKTNQVEEWKHLETRKEQSDEELVKAYDDEFTRIDIKSFYSGNATIFDHYVKLAPNKYVKILHKGEFFNHERLEKYVKNENVTHLYFLTKERAVYINFINKVVEKLNNSSTTTIDKKMGAVKNLVEKYVEEIYTKGLQPQMLEEGKKICDGLFKTLEDNDELRKLISHYQEMDPSAFSHNFLVSLFSTLICSKTEWATKRTIDIVAMGAMLHDLGKIKLPAEIRSMNVKNMNPTQRALYQQHPLYGNEMLQSNKGVPESVKQIIYQHHELVSGEGFPNQLTGIKMYPLAKIVSFADFFAHYIVERKTTPLKGLQELIKDRKNIRHYDPTVVRAFIKNFIKGRV